MQSDAAAGVRNCQTGRTLDSSAVKEGLSNVLRSQDSSDNMALQSCTSLTQPDIRSQWGGEKTYTTLLTSVAEVDDSIVPGVRNHSVNSWVHETIR